MIEGRRMLLNICLILLYIGGLSGFDIIRQGKM